MSTKNIEPANPIHQSRWDKDIIESSNLPRKFPFYIGENCEIFFLDSTGSRDRHGHLNRVFNVLKG